MATANPFDLLVDDDNEELTLLVAAAQQVKVEKPKKATPPGQGAQPTAKLPSKPVPPAQAVREARSEGGRGGSRGGGRGLGRGRGGGRGSDRDSSHYDNSFGGNNGFSGGYRPSEEENSGRSSERRGGSRGGFRGGRRGGFSNGEDGEGERPRRVFERQSGTGRGNEMKRDGSGRGNWGTPDDEVAVEAVETVKEAEKIVELDKPVVDEDVAGSAKESTVDEAKEQEPEDKEMTLEEYEKLLEEKRRVLLAVKTEERKVDKKAFESMQLLSNKKSNDDVFIKLGSEKDRRKDADKEDKAKKSVSINDFLKPAEGDRYHSPGGRGRGRGRGPRSGGYGGGNSYYNTTAPAIEDLGQFPSLGAKN